MSKRLLLAALLTIAAAAPARADFDSLVRAVSRMPGMHRVPIPALGLVRFAIWMVRPKGVYDFQLATFEGNVGRALSPSDRGRVENPTHMFEALLREHAEGGYAPLVQAHSRRSGELTLIWARPTGRDRIELLLLAHDPGDETVVLRTVVDVESLAREIADPHTATRVARR